MPCPDFVNARPEKSVPPKKSRSWRSPNLTSPGQTNPNFLLEFKVWTPDSGENRPLSMGPSTLQSDSQNEDGFRPLPYSRNLLEDMPLDFSLKPESKSRLPEDRASSSQGGQPSKMDSYAHHFRIPNGERNGGHLSHISNRTNPRFSPNNPENGQEPVKTVVSPKRVRKADYIDLNNSADHTDSGVRFSPTQTIKSPSPHLQSPSSSSKSPILAGMLAGNPPDILSGMPMEVLSPRLIPFGVPNGYPNGLSSMCLPGGIQNPNSVIPNPTLFPPSNILAASGLAFMQSQVNMIPPVSALPGQSKMENKATRKAKQERPFKNYDVSLRDDLQCNTLTWAVIPPPHLPTVDESSPPDVHHTRSVTVPNPIRTSAVNGNSENSLHSDPPSLANEFDSTPNTGVSHNAFEETAEMEKGSGGRKRKPVQD